MNNMSRMFGTIICFPKIILKANQFLGQKLDVIINICLQLRKCNPNIHGVNNIFLAENLNPGKHRRYFPKCERIHRAYRDDLSYKARKTFSKYRKLAERIYFKINLLCGCPFQFYYVLLYPFQNVFFLEKNSKQAILDKLLVISSYTLMPPIALEILYTV